MEYNEFQSFFKYLENKYLNEKKRILYPNIYYIEFLDFINKNSIKVSDKIINKIIKSCTTDEEIIKQLTEKVNNGLQEIQENAANIENHSDKILDVCNTGKNINQIEIEAKNIIYNISEMQKKIEHLEKVLAETQKEIYLDFLTNVYNRKKFNILWEKKFKNEDLFLAVIDIDNFKQINDTYGHLIGDSILKKVIEVLSKYIDKERIFRFGGDEFIAVIENTEKEKVKEIFTNIKNELNKKKFRINNSNKQVINVHLSVGIAHKNENDLTTDAVFEKADTALYKVKEEGKNNFKFFCDIKTKENK